MQYALSKNDTSRCNWNLSSYRPVAEKEPWCIETAPLVDIALFNTEEVQHRKKQSDDAPLVPPSLIGAARVLQELQYQFDVVDSSANFSKYKLLVLPDRVTFDTDTRELGTAVHEKLRKFVELGGSIIASFKSGVITDEKSSVNSETKERFIWEEIYGVKVDPSLEVYSPDYIIGEGDNFPSVEHGKLQKFILDPFLGRFNFDPKIDPLNLPTPNEVAAKSI